MDSIATTIPIKTQSPQIPATAAIILVVDDNEGNRDALSRRLMRRGYDVVTAKNGHEALAIIGGQSIDLVLLDVMMPGISGLEVLRQIRETHSATDLPVIMATAKDESKDIVKALGLGANDYVTKPLDFEVVVARVQTHLTLKQTVQKVMDLEIRLMGRNADLEVANAELVKNAEQRRQELESAARVQAAFLPALCPTIAGTRFAWIFEPCQELAGDCLNILPLDADHVAFYVLDVSGHGVASALLAVAASRILSLGGDCDSILIDKGISGDSTQPAKPADVARRLNEKFAWNSGSEQFLTLFYAVFNSRTRELKYVSAGHPAAIRLSRNGAYSALQGGGLPIGIGEGYEEFSIFLEPGERVYLYSDGVTESLNADKEHFGESRLVNTLLSATTIQLKESISLVLDALKTWQQGAPPRDDVTVLSLECA